MALQITEKWESGAGQVGKDSFDTYIAVVTGSVTEDDADDPYTVTSFAAEQFAWVSPFGNYASTLLRDRLGPGIWKFTATYRSPAQDRATGDSSFSFTTGGETQHVERGLGVTSSYVSPAYVAAYGDDLPAPFYNLLEVDRDGKFEGADRQVRNFEFKLTFYLSDTTMQAQNFATMLYQKTCCVNSDSVTFNIDGVSMTFQPGELLFKGAEGSRRTGKNDWEISLNFAARPNVNGSNELYPWFSQISYKGWDYCWMYKIPGLTQSSSGIGSTSVSIQTSIPMFLYFVQMYQYTTLTPLIIQSGFGPTSGAFSFGNALIGTAPNPIGQ